MTILSIFYGSNLKIIQQFLVLLHGHATSEGKLEKSTSAISTNEAFMLMHQSFDWPMNISLPTLETLCRVLERWLVQYSKILQCGGSAQRGSSRQQILEADTPDSSAQHPIPMCIYRPSLPC